MKLTASQFSKAGELRNSMVYNAALGRYKDFRMAKKEYSSLAVKDFEAIKKLPSPKITVPLFSKIGLRIAYVMIRNFFSIKTPEEKLLKTLAREEKVKQKIKYYNNMQNY